MRGSLRFQGAFPNFVSSVKLSATPILVVIDGDHDYKAAKTDIKTALEMRPMPFALAFHDYCLRSPNTDERVDDAVAELLRDVPRVPMGTSPEEDPSMPTESNPSPDGHYWKRGGTEGCFAFLPATRNRASLLHRIFAE